MKNLSAILLLLVHLSCTMLLPQVDARTSPGTFGNNCDVVNNMYEWVNEGLLHHHDAGTTDHHEEDAGLQADAPFADEFCSQLSGISHLPEPASSSASYVAPTHAADLRTMCYDKHTPPPEQLS